MCKALKPPENSRELRQALGQFPTGVAVVTVLRSDGRPIGKTISSFCSISLNPPLVGWYLDFGARTFNEFANCREFAVTVLSEEQANLASQFAGQSVREEELEVINGKPPLLPYGSAWFECKTYRLVPVGDHLMIVGKVARFEQGESDPLVFARSGYATLCETPALAS